MSSPVTTCQGSSGHGRRRIAAGVLVVITASGMAAGQTVLHVDDDAAPGGDGLSWGTAFRTIREATPDTGPAAPGTIVRVAQGLYTPRDVGSPSSMDSVMLINGMSLVGGYRGLSGGGDPGDRDPAAFVTVLDGGVGTLPGTEDDAQTLVKAVNCPESVVDGLTLQNARNHHILATDSGVIVVRGCRFSNSAGLPVSTSVRIARADAGATIKDCVFDAIEFTDAIVYISDAFEVGVSGCVFTDNACDPFNTPQVEYVLETYRCGEVVVGGCVFTGNLGADRLLRISDASEVRVHDVAMASNGRAPFNPVGSLINVDRVPGSVLIEGCVLTGNTMSLDQGLALELDGEGGQTVRRCVIMGNACNHMAVRAQNSGEFVAIEETLIAENTAVFISAVAAHCPLYVRGSTIAGNRASDPSRTAVLGTPSRIERSIIWGNQQGASPPSLGAQLRPQDLGAAWNSIVMGIGAGNGNLGLDPLFVGGGDYRLGAGSPAINLGLNPVTQRLNGGIDLGGRPRVMGGFVDAGCHEAELAAGCGPADLALTATLGMTGYRVPDGSLGGNDFFVYLEAWVGGDAAADLTTTNMPGSPGYGVPNGTLSQDDFFYYLGLYGAGC